MSEDEKQSEFFDSAPPHEEEDSNAANASLPTWDHARFLLEQGKTLYHSWTSTDAGLLEFQAARDVIIQVDAQDLLLDATLWIAHAHLKLKQYEPAAQNYFSAIRIMEQQQGMYSHATEQAYLWLSKALGDAGDTSRSLQAALTAARIEHYLAGPVGPHKSRTALQQALHKEYQYSAVEIAAMWTDMKDSIRWELEGDQLLKSHDHNGAFRAYNEAAKLERLQWGFQDNLRLPWLHRKAALTLLEPTELMTKVNTIDCPTLVRPLFCNALKQGDEYYLGKYSPGMATDAYSDSIGTFSKEITSQVKFPSWLFVLAFQIPFLWILVKWRRSNYNTQSWAVEKLRQAKEVLKETSDSPINPEKNIASDPCVDKSPNVVAIEPPSPDFHPLSESTSGQEILPALECSSLAAFKYHDDVASSVESLGRVLAGFETHMEFDHEDSDRSNVHVMSPIE